MILTIIYFSLLLSASYAWNSFWVLGIGCGWAIIFKFTHAFFIRKEEKRIAREQRLREEAALASRSEERYDYPNFPSSYSWDDRNYYRSKQYYQDIEKQYNDVVDFLHSTRLSSFEKGPLIDKVRIALLRSQTGKGKKSNVHTVRVLTNGKRRL